MREISRFIGDPHGFYANREALIEIDGINDGYVVKLYAAGELVESRLITGHTLQYAEDCAENWILGVI